MKDGQKWNNMELVRVQRDEWTGVTFPAPISLHIWGMREDTLWRLCVERHILAWCKTALNQVRYKHHDRVLRRKREGKSVRRTWDQHRQYSSSRGSRPRRSLQCQCDEGGPVVIQTSLKPDKSSYWLSQYTQNPQNEDGCCLLSTVHQAFTSLKAKILMDDFYSGVRKVTFMHVCVHRETQRDTFYHLPIFNRIFLYMSINLIYIIFFMFISPKSDFEVWKWTVG